MKKHTGVLMLILVVCVALFACDKQGPPLKVSQEQILNIEKGDFIVVHQDDEQWPEYALRFVLAFRKESN